MLHSIFVISCVCLKWSYGRWEKKGRKEAVFKDLKRWEAREIGENYKALLSIKQLKKAKAGKKPRKGGGRRLGTQPPIIISQFQLLSTSF